MVGLSSDAGVFFQFLLASYLMVLFFSFLEQIFIAALPNIIAAQALNGLAMSLFFGQQRHTDPPTRHDRRSSVQAPHSGLVLTSFFISVLLLSSLQLSVVCTSRRPQFPSDGSGAYIISSSSSRHTPRRAPRAPTLMTIDTF